MSQIVWSKVPMQVVQAFESRRQGRGPVGALVMWATWAVEGIHYLDDLDQEHGGKPLATGSHPSAVVDIAHVRWATGTSITSLDLCAAVLARECCAWTKAGEADMRDFDPRGKDKGISKRRAMLPAAALHWVDAVLADQQYADLQGARNPLTHSRLNRVLGSGRTEFAITATGRTYSAQDLILLAKDLATDCVNRFLTVVDGL